jgi:sarcosine oxidase delta subunit
MSFFLNCPNCGPREVGEFRHGGQVGDPPLNLPGLQEERWLHRLGCGLWLVAVRDVRTNVVTQTRLLDGKQHE